VYFDDVALATPLSGNRPPGPDSRSGESEISAPMPIARRLDRAGFHRYPALEGVNHGRTYRLPVRGRVSPLPASRDTPDPRAGSRYASSLQASTARRSPSGRRHSIVAVRNRAASCFASVHILNAVFARNSGAGSASGSSSPKRSRRARVTAVLYLDVVRPAERVHYPRVVNMRIQSSCH